MGSGDGIWYTGGGGNGHGTHVAGTIGAIGGNGGELIVSNDPLSISSNTFITATRSTSYVFVHLLTLYVYQREWLESILIQLASAFIFPRHVETITVMVCDVQKHVNAQLSLSLNSVD